MVALFFSTISQRHNIGMNIVDDSSTCVKSDNRAITFDVHIRMKTKQQTKRTVYNYKKGDFNGLREALNLLNLSDIVSSENDVDIAWMKWKDAFVTAVDTYIPKFTTKSKSSPPYVTSDLVHEIRKKETLREKVKKSNSPELWERFRDLRRKIKSEIRKKKREYIQGLAESVRDNSKEFWRFFKYKSNKSTLPDTMTHGDSRFSSSQAKAVAFNSYFASVFRPNTPSTSATKPVNNTDAVGLESITISAEEVCCLLSGLCTTKATGPDGISATLLRECATELAPSLTELFAMSLAHGKVPSEWKRANVVPVPKKNDPSEINNYRPISLLCIVSI